MTVMDCSCRADDHDEVITQLTRGFPGDDIFEQIRLQVGGEDLKVQSEVDTMGGTLAGEMRAMPWLQ